MEYYFKLDVEVTPDAEAQIVFDSKVGDLIKGYGSGNLKMEYTSDEEFYMYGDRMFRVIIYLLWKILSIKNSI